jgi:hypothetical protein
MQQTAALVGRDARVGGHGRGIDGAGRRHNTGVLVVHGWPRIRLEPGEALLVDDPPTERTTLGRRVFVVPVGVGEGPLLDRAVPPPLVHIGVRDGYVHADVVLPVVVQVLVHVAVQPAEPPRDSDADLAVVGGVVGVDGLPRGHGDRLEAHDVVQLLVPDAHVVCAGGDALDVEVPVLVAAALEDGLVGGRVGERDVRVVHGRVVGSEVVRRPLHPVACLTRDLTGATGEGPARRPVHGGADEAEPVRGAAARWLPQLLARRPGAVAALLDGNHQAEATVDGGGLGPGAGSGRQPVGRFGVRVAVLRRVHVGEVGSRTHVVYLHEAVVRRQADAAA